MAPRKNKKTGTTKPVVSEAKTSAPRAQKVRKPVAYKPNEWIPTFRRSTLRDYEDEKKHEEMIDDLNSQIPGSRERWGKTITGPISSLKKKGRAPKIKNYFNGRGSLDTLCGSNPNEDSTILIPNSPDRSPLLGLPIEVRENIYGFLLSQTKPVVVGPDWETSEGKILRYNSLQYVCKQIGDESSRFVYTNNVFLAMLQESPKAPACERTLFIDLKFLALFRNVVINCPAESWNMEWHEKAALAVGKLASANPALKSLTIVVSPTCGVGASTTAVGLETNPVHFADFFYSTGPLMTSIRKLRVKFLNIIVKKSITANIGGVPYTSEIKRLLMSIDLTHLQVIGTLGDGFSNEYTIAIAQEKASAAETELRNLKQKFEAIFEDCEKALQEGICRELAEDEAITDGTALATRK